MEQAEGQYSLTFMGPVQNRLSHDQNPQSPAFVSDASRRMYHRSRECRHLLAGKHAVVNNVADYLPRYPNEDIEDYNMRKKFLSLRNHYAQSVRSLLGKMFAQPPRLNEDVPSMIQQDLEDADMNGTHWTMVLRDYAAAAIVEGQSWLFCDWHPLPAEMLGELTLADERDLGLRPYWFVVKQSSVLGIRYRKVGRVYTLTQFRFIEWVEEDDGEFGTKMVEVIYVYEPHRVRSFRKAENGDWVTASDNPNTLGRIPAVPLNLRRIGRYEAAPPLEDLADMNFEHLQVRSDQRRALSVASFPVLVTSGVEAAPGESTRIGPMTSIMLEDPSAGVKWVESQGVHIRLGMDELTKLEEDMRVFGLAFENPQAYATATGRSLDNADAVAPIQLWAHQLRDAVEVSLQQHAAWRKLNTGGGSVDVNVSYVRNQISVEGLKLLIEALKEGALTPRGLLTRLKEYGLLGEDFDVDKDIQEAAKIAEEAAKKLAAVEAAKNPKPDDNNGGSDDQAE